MQICWLTDIHLNLLSHQERVSFYQQLLEKPIDALLITGDIAEGASTLVVLAEMCQHLSCPIYFILGNHDYFYHEIEPFRAKINAFCKKNPQCFWLRSTGVQQISGRTLILGVDSWADLRYGNYAAGKLRIYYQDIIDFQSFITNSAAQFKQKLQAIADHDASILKAQMIQAISSQASNIMILVHVVPYAQACWRKGTPCDPETMPFFTNKMIGEIIYDCASANPQKQFLVLCGHTHHSYRYTPLKNLKVIVGDAKSGSPRIQFHTCISQLFPF